MELTSNKTLETIVRERRLMPRFHLLTRVDIAVAGGGDLYWGSMLNLSRTGVAVVFRHHLKPKQRATVRFHFQSLYCRGGTEEVIAQGDSPRGGHTQAGNLTPRPGPAPLPP